MAKLEGKSTKRPGRDLAWGMAMSAGALLMCGITQATAQTAAQAWPAKPVRIIVPVVPGGPSDLMARLLGSKLSEGWGQPVLVDNRAGATGIIAAEAAYKAPSDGYTMFSMALTQFIATLVHQKYLLARDFASVTMVGATPFTFAVGLNVPAKNIAEWIAYARSRPGELNYASTGMWGAGHLCMESFNALTGIKTVHVPHPGAPQAANALMGGEVSAYCAAALSVAKLAQAGKLRLIGVTYQQPTKLLPDVAPISDTVPGFEVLGWYGLQVGKGTPNEVINKINTDLVRVIKNPEMGERLVAMGVDPLGTTPAEFSAYLQKESDRWSKILKERNARPEDL